MLDRAEEGVGGGLGAVERRSMEDTSADASASVGGVLRRGFFFFFFTLVTGPRRSLSLKLSDTRVCASQIRARLGTTAHFWQELGAADALGGRT